MNTKQLSFAALAAGALLQFSGCSLIGYGIGSAIDGPRYTTIKPSQSDTLRTETDVEVLLRNGKQIKGETVGSRGTSQPSSMNDAAAPHLEPRPLAERGDTITVVAEDEAERAIFIGLTPNSLQVKDLENAKSQAIKLNLVDTVRLADGTTVEGNALRLQVVLGNLTLLRTVAVEIRRDTVYVPIEDIAELKRVNPTPARKVFSFVGGVVDAAAIIGGILIFLAMSDALAHVR
jgi:hypothetical protein